MAEFKMITCSLLNNVLNAKECDATKAKLKYEAWPTIH